MKLSYDAVWQDVMRLLRAHADMILVLTGVFIFLPWLAQALYFPPPVMVRFDATSLQAYLTYLQDHFPAILAQRLMGLLGTGAILTLLICADRPTVGDGITRAGRLLPSLLMIDILVQTLWTLGLLALIIPGLYLMGRTCVSQAAMMAEQIANPLRAITRSFALTHQIGWQVFGFIAIIGVVTWIGTSAAITVIGVVAKLLLPAAATTQVHAVLAAISTSLISVVAIVVPAALYRELSTRNSGT